MFFKFGLFAFCAATSPALASVGSSSAVDTTCRAASASCIENEEVSLNDTQHEQHSCNDCSYDGETYCTGESFPDADGCNTCTCKNGGSISCTMLFCIGPCVDATCTYGMEGNVTEYCSGESFVALDGINICICNDAGIVSCTKEEKKRPPTVILSFPTKK